MLTTDEVVGLRDVAQEVAWSEPTEWMNAERRLGPTRRPARPASFRRRQPDRRLDREGEAADPADRPGHAQRGIPRTGRSRFRDRRTERAKDRGDGPAAGMEIRAPIGGVVYQIAVHTVGGIIEPGEQIMLIVPDKELSWSRRKSARWRSTASIPGNPQPCASPRSAGETRRNTDGTLETFRRDFITDERTGVEVFQCQDRISPPPRRQESARLARARHAG